MMSFTKSLKMFSALTEQRGLDAMESLVRQLAKTHNNAEFLATLKQRLA
jgi:transcription termination factor Rho